MPNDTIHTKIESWLVADVHDQLSNDERAAFEQHLAACPACHALQQEEKNMNQLLENTLAKESADPAFEERMVRRFRDGAPAPASGLIALLTKLMRMRATQIAAVAAVLLTLVQVGKMLTGEGRAVPLPEARMAITHVMSRDEEKSRPEQDLTASLRARAAEGAAPMAKAFPSTDALANGGLDSDKPLVPAAPPLTAEQRQNQGDLNNRGAAGASGQPASDVTPGPVPATPADNRKLIRNAQLELQVTNYEEATQRLTSFAAEAHGFVATQSSSKLPNGKLQGTIVIKVLPENLESFLQKARGLGNLKNQTLGTEDVTKAYFDTDARLRNAKRMEERLLDILKTKTGKVSDLLQVEKELGRVREQIEQMHGELKYYDALVQYATVTISLAEKDLNEPAAFLLKETANLSLFSSNVEKTFAEVKSALENDRAQIVQSTLERDNSGQATARMMLLLAPEESDVIIAKIKSMGRVQNFNVQTERVEQNGSGMSETARVERDKVQFNLVVSRAGEEQAVQRTTLRILTSSVTEKVARLKAEVEKAGGELRSSTFSRDPNGQEVADLTLRVPMKNYAGLVGSFARLGEVKDLSVQRTDQPGTTANPEAAPADISVQIYN
ncbi:MAG: DUF4349 domain-containing protein, partial [Chthoniobacterales bacterium]